MVRFRCESCGKSVPLSDIHKGWKYGEPMVCQKCWETLKLRLGMRTNNK